MRIQPKAGFRYVLMGHGTPEMPQGYLEGRIAGEKTCGA